MTSDAVSKLFNEVPASQLRNWASFLKLDVLRPGDVLLSRGRDWMSWVIAIATGGCYSHVGIFLPFSYDSTFEIKGIDDPEGTHLTLVESDGGVGKTFLRELSIDFGRNACQVGRLPD